jgi:predicted esterase
MAPKFVAFSPDKVSVSPFHSRGKHKATVILIHGQGRSSADFDGLYKLFNAGKFREHANVITLEFPGGSWFDFVSNDPTELAHMAATGKEIADRKSLEKAAAFLRSIVEDEVQNFSEKYENVYLVGHSQGAMLALWTGLTIGHKLGGIVSIAGALPVINPVEEIKKSCKHTPVYHIHSRTDKNVPYLFAQVGMNKVIATGCNPYDMMNEQDGHLMERQTDQLVNKWLENLIKP